MAPADRNCRKAMRLDVEETTVAEAMALFAVLPDHVAMEIAQGDAHDAFLFVRGVFCGSPSSLRRLRHLLAEDAAVAVTLHAHPTLAALYGPPITALELVLDPTGTLGTG